MRPDSVFFELANDIKLFLTTLLSRGTIGNNRTDYRRMVELAVFYLGGEVENFYFHQPPPCHEARFMADAIYLLMLHLTSRVVTILSVDEKKEVEKLVFYITLFYIPSFIRSTSTMQAPSIDLKNLKTAKAISMEEPNLGTALIKSLGRHIWYLYPDTVFWL